MGVCFSGLLVRYPFFAAFAFAFTRLIQFILRLKCDGCTHGKALAVNSLSRMIHIGGFGSMASPTFDVVQ